jgi:hypothetical protein
MLNSESLPSTFNILYSVFNIRKKEQLRPGDCVEGSGGSLRNMNGVIVSIKGNRACLPKHSAGRR